MSLPHPPQWIKWEELPWFSRGQTGGSLLKMCDRMLSSATKSAGSAPFLRHELPEIANEFSLQWAGVLGRTPAWKVFAEFGRRLAPELPYRFLEESLDRDAAGLLSPAGEAEDHSAMLISVPLKGEDGPGQLLVLVGKTLNRDSLPAALAVGRALGIGLQVTRRHDLDAHRIDRLRTTLEISSQFAAARESEPLLEMIAEEAMRLLDSDRASIFIWDRALREVVACPAVGVEGGMLRLPDNVGIVGDVIQSGSSIRVDDAYKDPRFNKSVDAKSGYKTRNLLCVPLLDAEGERIGAFEVINKREGHFSDLDEESLAELGTQA